MNEEGLYQYLKDMENCQINLHKGMQKIEERLNELCESNKQLKKEILELREEIGGLNHKIW